MKNARFFGIIRKNPRPPRRKPGASSKMAYLFSVNETNRHICIQNQLFGVPATERARSQILNVRKEDKLFLYVYGTGLVYGVYEAITDPFVEKEPEKGPWNVSPIDKNHGYYPYRIYINIIKNYQNGIPFKKLESLDIGLTSQLLQRKSAVYISDFQAKVIEELLSDKPLEEGVAPPKRIDYSNLESLFTKEVSVTDSQEKTLQLLVQSNFSKLETGAVPVTSYFNIKYGTINGEVDVLGRDKHKNYIITELKAENLRKDIWTQLLTYSHVIRDIYAKHAGVDVRSFIVCPGFDRKTFYSYPELKKLLKYENSLRVFRYETNFRDKIEFEEIPIKI